MLLLCVSPNIVLANNSSCMVIVSHSSWEEQYHIAGNLQRRKHSQFENWKLVSKKIFANDKSFNLVSCEN